jgi:hypothetical protein
MTEARFRRHPDLRLTALEGEGVVLHLKERRYFTVNETGLVLLEALKEPQSMNELVDALLREYEVSDATARETTQAFLSQCLEAAVVLEQDE